MQQLDDTYPCPVMVKAVTDKSALLHFTDEDRDEWVPISAIADATKATLLEAARTRLKFVLDIAAWKLNELGIDV